MLLPKKNAELERMRGELEITKRKLEETQLKLLEEADKRIKMGMHVREVVKDMLPAIRKLLTFIED